MTIIQMHWYSPSRLPSSYQEVEWIQDSWTQYIDANIQLWANDFEISWEFMMDEVTSYQQQIVSIWTSSYNYWNLFIRTYGSTRYLDLYLSWHNMISSITTTQKYTFNVKRSSSSWTWWFWNNTSTVSYSPWSVNNTTVKLFRLWGWDYWSDTYSKIKMYSCKIYVAWTLVRDFIPCYRKSDSVIWMYDFVNKVFYTNAGTWTFTKWPDVN